MTWGRYRIRDFRDHGDEMSVEDVIVKSSNIGTARMALMIGGEASAGVPQAAGAFRDDVARDAGGRHGAAASAAALVGHRDDDGELRPWHFGEPDAPCRRLCDDRERRTQGGADATGARDERAPASR